MHEFSMQLVWISETDNQETIVRVCLDRNQMWWTNPNLYDFDQKETISQKYQKYLLIIHNLFPCQIDLLTKDY